MSCGVVMNSKWKNLLCSWNSPLFSFCQDFNPISFQKRKLHRFHTSGSGGGVWIPLLYPHRGDEASRGLRNQEPF